MGYGNSLFDGDEPLPPANQKQRILSMRLWLGAALAGAAAGEGSGLTDRHHEPEGSARGAESEWHQDQRENQHRG